MSNLHQKIQNALTLSECLQCSGSGTIDDASPGDMFYNERACPKCNSSGVKDIGGFISLVTDICSRVLNSSDAADIKEPSFSRQLEALINSHSLENWSNTSDFILAQYLIDCLDNFSVAASKRDSWYGNDVHEGTTASSATRDFLKRSNHTLNRYTVNFRSDLSVLTLSVLATDEKVAREIASQDAKALQVRGYVWEIVSIDPCLK